MSFYALVDICLHFYSFRNIDLFHQGLYNIRVRLYTDLADEFSNSTSQCYAAYPYASIPSSDDWSGCACPDNITYGGRPLINPDIHTTRIDHHRIFPSIIDESGQTFTTRSFLIRYCDEEIELNELVQFRIELDLCQFQALRSSLYIEVDLMFFDPTNPASTCSGVITKDGKTAYESSPVTNKQSSAATADSMATEKTELFASPIKNKGSLFLNTSVSLEEASSPPEQQVNNKMPRPTFTSVAYQIYKLHLPALGMHEHIPIVFDEFHFSFCSAMVHTALQDIRCRLRSNSQPCAYSPRHKKRRGAPTLNYGFDPTTQTTLDSINTNSGAYVGCSSTSSSSVNQKYNNQRSLPNGYADHSQRFLIKGHRGLDLISGSSQVFVTNITENGTGDGKETNTISSNPMVARADLLHKEYIRVLLNSFVRVTSVFRCLSWRCLTFEQRKHIDALIEIPPLQLPGGDVVLLPGAWTTIDDNDKNALLRQATTRGSLSARPVKTAGVAFYTPEDLLTITVHLSTDAIVEELCCRTSKDDDDRDEDHLTPQNVNKPLPLESFQKQMSETSVNICATIPKLSAQLQDDKLSSIAAIFSQDFQLIGSQVMSLWQRLVQFLPLIGPEVDCVFRSLHERRIADRWREAVLRETCTGTTDLTQPTEKSLWETHQKIADHLRKSPHYNSLDPLPVTDIFLMPTPETQPIVFEQRYLSDILKNKMRHTTLWNSLQAIPMTPRGYRGIHLFVLVHGFQGNSYDMRLLKNILSLNFPAALFICSAANEDDTDSCIEEMGKKLAEEVTHYIDDWCPIETIDRISFICHSLGGVIARAALRHLASLWPKFYTFASLSSPHLGYMYNSNKLVDAGLWVMKKWKKSISLQQLTLSDSKVLKETVLYRLSTESEALGYFHNLCLISSYQDQYVPFDSARIEHSAKAASDTKLGSIYGEMARNTLKCIKPENLIRFDVNFKISEKSLDTFIGRAAHIQFLENHTLMRMLIGVYPQLFY